MVGVEVALVAELVLSVGAEPELLLRFGCAAFISVLASRLVPAVCLRTD